jgi:hypothetical protein
MGAPEPATTENFDVTQQRSVTNADLHPGARSPIIRSKANMPDYWSGRAEQPVPALGSHHAVHGYEQR